MDIDKFNHEGYSAPTTYEALTNIHREEVAADIENNVRNAKAYSRFAVESNAIQVTPHLLYPQFMDDSNEMERELAMHFNYVLLGKCTELWVFGGVVSCGMAREIGVAKKRKMKIRWFDHAMKEVMSMLDFTIYAADCVGNSGNCLYPNKMVVTDKESFIAATKMDHVTAKYKGNYRSKDNFESSDCIPLDCDNDHSENQELELAIIPESFRTDILKEEQDANNVLVENANSETGSFALLFEFDGDIRKIRHVLYNCTASRPKIESKTYEDEKEVQAETLTIKARPMADGYVKAKTGDATTDTIYNNWDKSVYQPASEVAVAKTTTSSTTSTSSTSSK